MIKTKSQCEVAAKEIEKLFNVTDKNCITVRSTTHNGKPAIEVECGDMYCAPAYIGKGGVIGMLTAIQNIVEGNRIDEGPNSSREGCETCDYGSFYSRNFIVWEENEG